MYMIILRFAGYVNIYISFVCAHGTILDFDSHLIPLFFRNKTFGV